MTLLDRPARRSPLPALTRRRDFIEDVATAVWGGEAAEARVKSLRGKS